jgi:ABC-type antimicrobial peptide transport system permease subunit
MNNVVVRTRGEPRLLAQQVRAELRGLDPDLPAFAIRTMDELFDRSIALRRFYMMLLSGLAAIALLLSAVGIYAQLAYTASERMREIGLRMALGAQRWDVLKLIVGQGLALAVVGAALGLVAAFWMSKLLSRLLYGVTPLDAVTFAAAPALLLAIAAAACVIPSWRATQGDPATVLRYE